MKLIHVFSLLCTASSASSMASDLPRKYPSKTNENKKLRGSRHLNDHRGHHDTKPEKSAPPPPIIDQEETSGVHEPHVSDTAADSLLVREAILEGDNIVVQYEGHPVEQVKGEEEEGSEVGDMVPVLYADNDVEEYDRPPSDLDEDVEPPAASHVKKEHPKKERVKEEHTKKGHVKKVHPKKERHEKKERAKNEHTQEEQLSKKDQRQKKQGAKERGKQKQDESSKGSLGEIEMPFGMSMPMSMPPRDADKEHPKKTNHKKKEQVKREKKRLERGANVERDLKQRKSPNDIKKGHNKRKKGVAETEVSSTDKEAMPTKKKAEKFDNIKEQIEKIPEKTEVMEGHGPKVAGNTHMIIDDPPPPPPPLNEWLPTPAPSNMTPFTGTSSTSTAMTEEASEPILVPVAAPVDRVLTPWPTDASFKTSLEDAPLVTISDPTSLTTDTSFPSWSPTSSPIKTQVVKTTTTAATSNAITTEKTTTFTSTAAVEEVSVTTTDPALMECPPAYDPTKSTYKAGDIVEVLEHIFQCHAGVGVMADLYEPYCNIREWHDDLLELNPEAKVLWKAAWVNMGPCQPVLLAEVLADEIINGEI